MPTEIKSYTSSLVKTLPCSIQPDNTYVITIDADQLKLATAFSFVDPNNKKVIAQLNIEGDNFKFSADGHDIDIRINGRLDGCQYTFLNPDGTIKLDADFSTKQNLNVKTYAKQLQYHGRMFAANSLEWLAKGHVEIAEKSSVRANHDMHLCMSGLELNGQLSARTIKQEFVEDFIVNETARLSTRELNTSAKNVKNQSAQLTFNKADFNLENNFVNYPGGMIKNKKILNIKADNLWNAGVIDFGKNLDVTLSKLFVQGITADEDLHEFLKKHELYPQAILKGEDAKINTNASLDLYGLNYLHSLNLTAITELNLATTIAAHNKKTRRIALDLGIDIPNVEETKKDILEFIRLIQARDYHSAFMMLLASDMGKKAEPYLTFLLDTLYPMLQKHLGCDQQALIYVISDVKLMKQIKLFHSEDKDALPLHVLLDQAVEVVNSGLAQQQNYDSDALSPLALKLTAAFLPTIKHKASVEERIGGLHISSHIKHKTEASNDYGVTQVATNISEKFKQASKVDQLDIAKEINHQGDILRRSGVVVAESDLSRVGLQIEEGEITADTIKWQADDLKLSGNLKADTGWMNGINISLRGNTKVAKLTATARELLDIPGTNQLSNGDFESKTIHISGYSWLEPTTNDVPTLNTNAQTTILEKSNGIIGDKATVMMSTEHGRLEGDQNLGTFIAHADHDLNINNKACMNEAHFSAGDNLTYDGQTIFPNNDNVHYIGMDSKNVYLTPKSNVVGDGNINLQGKEVYIEGTQTVDTLVAKAENHLDVKSHAELDNEILTSKNTINYAASTTFKDDNRSHLLAMVADTINMSPKSEVNGDGTMAVVGKTIAIDGQQNVTALQATGEQITVKGEAVLHQEKLMSQNTIDYAAETQFKDNDHVIKNQFVAEADQFNMTPKSAVSGDGSFNVKAKAATLSNVDTTSIHYEVDHLPNLIDFMMSRGMYFGVHAREDLHVKIKDPVELNENMSLPLSTTVEAPTINITANIKGSKNLGFIADSGNVTTANNQISVDGRLLIDAENNYENYRGNIYANNGLYIHAKQNARNSAGSWLSPFYTQVIADYGDIINEATQRTIQGRFGDMQQYTPANIIGGTGEINNGIGVYLKAGGKVLNDASKIYSVGGNYILANKNIDNLSRINRFRSYYKHWNKWNGERTTEEYSWQIQSPSIYSMLGKNQLISQHGAINTSALDLFAKDGNELSAEGNINLDGLVLKKVCEKKGEFFGGITHENNKRETESNTPTIALDHNNSTIISSNDVNILNALLMGVGDLRIKGKNVTVSAPILNHSYEEDTLSLGYRLPDLSCIPGYSMYEDMQMLKGSNDKKAAGIWNLGIDGVNTFNNTIAAFRNKSFTNVCNPTVEINYTHTHTLQKTQTVADNVGIARHGSLDIEASKKVSFTNAVPVQIDQDATISGEEFIQKGAALKSSFKQDSEAVTGGVNLNLEPTVGVRASFSKSSETNYQNQKFRVGEKTTVNADKWHAEAANLETNELSGNVGDLTVVSPVNKSDSLSASVEANTGGTLSANFAEQHSSTIGEASCIHVKKDINGDNSPHFHAETTTLEGAKITADGVNNFETNHLITKTVNESTEGFALGISGNVNDNDCDKQAIPTANTHVGYKDYHAKQDATIYGEKGTKPNIQTMDGKLNTANAKGLEVEKDTHLDVDVKVPTSTKNVFKQTKENIAWLNSKFQPQKKLNKAGIVAENEKDAKVLEDTSNEVVGTFDATKLTDKLRSTQSQDKDELTSVADQEDLQSEPPTNEQLDPEIFQLKANRLTRWQNEQQKRNNQTDDGIIADYISYLMHEGQKSQTWAKSSVESVEVVSKKLGADYKSSANDAKAAAKTHINATVKDTMAAETGSDEAFRGFKSESAKEAKYASYGRVLSKFAHLISKAAVALEVGEKIMEVVKTAIETRDWGKTTRSAFKEGSELTGCLTGGEVGAEIAAMVGLSTGGIGFFAAPVIIGASTITGCYVGKRFGEDVEETYDMLRK